MLQRKEAPAPEQRKAIFAQPAAVWYCNSVDMSHRQSAISLTDLPQSHGDTCFDRLTLSDYPGPLTLSSYPYPLTLSLSKGAPLRLSGNPA